MNALGVGGFRPEADIQLILLRPVGDTGPRCTIPIGGLEPTLQIWRLALRQGVTQWA